MLVIIATGLPKTAGQVYEAMGLRRAPCRKIATTLEAVGAIAAHRSDFGIQFEVDLGGVRVDGVMTNKRTGQRIYCQIGVSKPDHEVDNIQRFFAPPASQNAKFVLVTRDVPFVKEVKRLFKARKIADAIVKQVHIRVIADLVKE